MKIQPLFTLAAASAMFAPGVPAQQPAVDKPDTPVVRPWLPTELSPLHLDNSHRLSDLIRGGKLYLTVQDAIALAIENNLGLEVDRYGPLSAEWALKRAQAGGLLPGVPSGSSQVGQVASGQGVAGSQSANGVSATGGGGGGGQQAGGAAVTQIGPVTANLDPVLQNSTVFSHLTTPQVNTVQSATNALIESTHAYNTFLRQGLLSGGYLQAQTTENYLKENALDVLNPSVAPRVSVSLQHSLLQGFGTKVNSRFIRIGENNVTAAGLTFRSQLLNLVANILNLYWDLASYDEDRQAKQRALDVAQKFYEDTVQEIQLGVLSKMDVIRPQAEVAARKLDLSISNAALLQQQNLLKDALSRTGTSDPLIADVDIVPLDRMQVPQKDDVAPLRELVATAVSKRPDIANSRLNLQTSEISALGTANVLLPSLTGLLSATGAGLSGSPQGAGSGFAADPYFVGGLGSAFGQIFRRNFPTERAAVLFTGQIGIDRVDAGDYAIDQLQLRQTRLTNQRDLNQLVVDISNQVVALRQARARYAAATEARILQEKLLDSEQQKFSLGSSNTTNIINAQRSLVQAQSVEIAALTAYSHARVSLDQVLGVTLETNNVSVDEALSGHVNRPSRPPEIVGQKN